GADRAREQEMRAAGMRYLEIAQQGGGIHQSVRDLRSTPDAELLALAKKRLRKVASYGTTTVEIKSGYGLSLEDELRMLRIVRTLQDQIPVRIIPTWLGAHEIPLDFRGRDGGREDYITLLINEMLPAVVQEKLALFADVFCEPGVFTIEESRMILGA